MDVDNLFKLGAPVDAPTVCAGIATALEIPSPQPPANYSYRFNRDRDYLAEQLSTNPIREPR